ncbi:hypothetical protein L596_025428 [Steinernema carpocapsae]|uniref:Uncharacterized protein n=1 Tax=Steinernema carpocapsae TaxID=34508 RepID=A0A4U5M7Q8_STECR|nr:hypothetical protein L596_025428 [Steinernema carpocapsae]
MVCVPCIILPVLTFVYIKFIQPLIYRLMPEEWKVWLDSVLYPTCKLEVPKPAEKKTESETGEEEKKPEEKKYEECPCATTTPEKNKDD